MSPQLITHQTYAVWWRLPDGAWDKLMGRLTAQEAAALITHYRRRGYTLRRTTED